MEPKPKIEENTLERLEARIKRLEDKVFRSTKTTEDPQYSPWRQPWEDA